MPELSLDKLLVVVVAADLRGELFDRPSAYRLRDSAQTWIDHHLDETDPPLMPIVCTDALVLNYEPLQQRPLISIGGPGINGCSAHLQPHLPIVLQVDDRLVIQMDVELADLRATVWGVDRTHTAAAAELFEQKYLGDFLRAAATQVEPEGD